VKTGKKLASYEATLALLDRSWRVPSENPDHHPKNIEPFSQEMHLKMPLSRQGLKLPN
jgi:hypothetical protein